MIDAQYTLGGVPNILIPLDLLQGSGLCGTELTVISGNGGKAAPLNASAGLANSVPLIFSLLAAGIAYLLAVL